MKVLATALNRTTVGCDKLIEAGWLTALVITPLFFNSLSFRSFEPDKIVLLRSIALVMVLAWIIKGLEGFFSRAPEAPRQTARLGPGPRFWRGELSWSRFSTVVLLFALLFFAAQVLSTAVSVAPFTSLWGSYHRLQGLYTTGAYAVVFLSLIALVHERTQIERLITTVLLASAPIAFYGIVQHAGMDPVVWSRGGRSPVRSTMGNEIFLAAYLIMVVPLAIHRLRETGAMIADRASRTFQAVFVAVIVGSLALLVAAWWSSVEEGVLTSVAVSAFGLGAAVALRRSRRLFVRMAAYNVLLSVQIACVLFSESRGPFVGLLAGLFFFGLFWTVVKQKWQWTVSFVGVGIVALGILLLINTAASPLQFVQDTPVWGRLTKIFVAEGPARVRLLLWEGALELASNDPFRAVLGYGPETIRVASSPYYNPELGTLTPRDTVPDRTHNETFDVFITTGLLGFVAYSGLMVSIFVMGLRQIGVATSPRNSLVFLALSLGSALGLALLARLFDDSWRLLALCLPAGVLMGLVLFVLGYTAVRLRAPPHPGIPRPHPPDPLIVTLLAAIVCHFVEIHFGIATASTRMLFWTLVALSIVAARRAMVPSGVALERVPADEQAVWPSEPEDPGLPPAAPAAEATSPLQESSTMHGEAPSYILLMVGLIMLTLGFDFAATGSAPAVSPGFAWLLTGTCTLLGLVALVEAWPSERVPRQGYRLLEYIGFYGSACLASLFVSRLIYETNASSLVDYHPAFPLYVLSVLLLLVVVGVVLARARDLPPPSARRRRALLYPVLVATTGFLIWMTNLKVVEADIYFRQGWLAEQQSSDRDRMIEGYRRAVELAPRQDFYRVVLAGALSQMALATTDAAHRNRLFDEAEKVLLYARRLNPLEPDNTVSLARLYRHRFTAGEDKVSQTSWLRRAITYYEAAIQLSPNRVQFWNEWATTHRLLGELDIAISKYEHALSLDPKFLDTYLLLGEAYRAARNWEAAQRVLREAVRQNPDSIDARASLADAYAWADRVASAIREYEAVLDRAPLHRASYRNVILLHLKEGDCRQAAEKAQRAYALMPEASDIARLKDRVAVACGAQGTDR